MLRCICDTCGTAASAVYCHTDSTYLCSGCDDFIHAEANPMASHHFRVPIQTATIPSFSLSCGEFSALNQCQAETSTAAREGFFYYGSDTGECLKDLITLTSSCSDHVFQTSCGSHRGIQQVCGDVSMPTVHSIDPDKSLQRMKLPEVGTVQAPSVYMPPNCQTVPKSESYSIGPEIALSFTTHQSSRRPEGKTVECSGHPSAENPISREERVQRFREKRKAKNLRMKIKFPSKKAYAASIRPRINGKFASRPTDQKVELNLKEQNIE